MTPEERQARIDELAARILPAAQAAARRMAEQLVDRPDAQMFGAIEYELRDAAHGLAAEAHRTGLDARKKGATRVARSSARGAGGTPAATPSGPAPS